MSELKLQSTLLLLFLSAYFFFLPTLVNAHILKADGAIGAVLHIDPEDDPIVGQQAGFFFEFKDKRNKFQSSNCDCIFSIIQGGKEIFNQPLFKGNSNPSLTNASVFFRFPERDVYQVRVVGKPITSDKFQPFTLTYDIRVSREDDINSGSKPSSSANILVIISSVIFLLFIAFIVSKLKKGR